MHLRLFAFTVDVGHYNTTENCSYTKLPVRLILLGTTFTHLYGVIWIKNSMRYINLIKYTFKYIKMKLF